MSGKRLMTLLSFAGCVLLGVGLALAEQGHSLIGGCVALAGYVPVAVTGTFLAERVNVSASSKEEK